MASRWLRDGFEMASRWPRDDLEMASSSQRDHSPVLEARGRLVCGPQRKKS